MADGGEVDDALENSARQAENARTPIPIATTPRPSSMPPYPRIRPSTKPKSEPPKPSSSRKPLDVEKWIFGQASSSSDTPGVDVSSAGQPGQPKRPSRYCWFCDGLKMHVKEKPTTKPMNGYVMNIVDWRVGARPNQYVCDECESAWNDLSHPMIPKRPLDNPSQPYTTTFQLMMNARCPCFNCERKLGPDYVQDITNGLFMNHVHFECHVRYIYPSQW